MRTCTIVLLRICGLLQEEHLLDEVGQAASRFTQLLDATASLFKFEWVENLDVAFVKAPEKCAKNGMSRIDPERVLCGLCDVR